MSWSPQYTRCSNRSGCLESRSEKLLYDLSYTRAGFTDSDSPMVRSLNYGLSGCVLALVKDSNVFLDKTLYSRSASLELGV